MAVDMDEFGSMADYVNWDKFKKPEIIKDGFAYMIKLIDSWGDNDG